jgi:hypothetical protein
MGGTGERVTVLASSGSGLVRSLAELPPGARWGGVASGGGELWFVVEGSGALTLGGEPGPALVPDRGLWIPASSGYEVECHAAGGLRLDIVALSAMSSGGAAPASTGRELG